MIGTWRKCGRSYYLDLDSKPLACSNFVYAFDQYYWLGHPSLQALKFSVPESNHVTSLDCESCQLGTHHHVSYPNRVNKKANNPFVLIHSDVYRVLIQ